MDHLLAVGLAIEAAETAMAAGELPIGAVVVMGERVVATAHTQENAAGGRLVHADLLAMIAADRVLGWQKRPAPLQLAVNLEPCMMCLGAAMSLGVNEIAYGIESPSDGAATLATRWRQPSPAMPSYRAPAIFAGIHRLRCRDQFRRYLVDAPAPSLRRWASSIADLSD